MQHDYALTPLWKNYDTYATNQLSDRSCPFHMPEKNTNEVYIVMGSIYYAIHNNVTVRY